MAWTLFKWCYFICTHCLRNAVKIYWKHGRLWRPQNFTVPLPYFHVYVHNRGFCILDKKFVWFTQKTCMSLRGLNAEKVKLGPGFKPIAPGTRMGIWDFSYLSGTALLWLTALFVGHYIYSFVLKMHVAVLCLYYLYVCLNVRGFSWVLSVLSVHITRIFKP